MPTAAPLRSTLARSLSRTVISRTTASGHHGTGISYDLTKIVESKGVIVSFAFRNPHAQLYWDAKDEKGEIVHWSAEMNAPSNVERAGFS